MNFTYYGKAWVSEVFMADINAIDENGETALIRAVRRQDYNEVKSLISQGADVNKPTRDDGSTPLIWAVANAQGGDYSVAHLLLDNNAKTLPKNQDGNDVLFYLEQQQKKFHDLAGDTPEHKQQVSDATYRATQLHYHIDRVRAEEIKQLITNDHKKNAGLSPQYFPSIKTPCISPLNVA